MSVHIRPAKAEDLEDVMLGLQSLAADLGDAFNASAAQVKNALFGPHPIVRAQLAYHGAALVGLAYYAPMFSTLLGTAGCYVSDLWSHKTARGQGLGVQLLAAVQADAAATWNGGFIKLAAYRDNAAALAFYRKLGFEVLADEHALRLSGAALRALGDAG